MITWKWRLALAAKAALLLAIAASFLWIAALTLLEPSGLATIIGLASGGTGAFLVWASMRGFADAVVGESVTEEHAVALKSRRSGVSVRFADGRLAEYILLDSWQPLQPDAKYIVTYGRYSRVIVKRPEPASDG